MKRSLSAKWRGEIGGVVALVAISPGLIVIVRGCGIFIQQVRDWLRTGVWTAHSVFEPLHYYLGMEYPKVSWWAVQKLADVLLSFPASLCLLLFGYFLTMGLALLVGYPLSKLGLISSDEKKDESAA